MPIDSIELSHLMLKMESALELVVSSMNGRLWSDNCTCKKLRVLTAPHEYYTASVDNCKRKLWINGIIHGEGAVLLKDVLNKERPMLCKSCGTVVQYEKEDYAKLVFQTGEKHLYHMECFALVYLSVKRITEAQNEAQASVFSRRVSDRCVENGWAFSPGDPRYVSKPAT